MEIIQNSNTANIYTYSSLYCYGPMHYKCSFKALKRALVLAGLCRTRLDLLH